MSASLVGSEMCIRDRLLKAPSHSSRCRAPSSQMPQPCSLAGPWLAGWGARLSPLREMGALLQQFL
eukprot:7233781-Alexandrium_andersonii.AAC.1